MDEPLSALFMIMCGFVILASNVSFLFLCKNVSRVVVRGTNSMLCFQKNLMIFVKAHPAQMILITTTLIVLCWGAEGCILRASNSFGVGVTYFHSRGVL